MSAPSLAQPPRWFWPVLIAAILIAGIWAARTIHFQSELLPIFPRELSSVKGLQTFQDKFASAQEVIVVIEGAPLDVWSGTHRINVPIPSIEFRETLEQNLRRIPEAESVTTLGDFTPKDMAQVLAWGVANLPPVDFAQFQAIFTPTELKTRLVKTQSRLSGVMDPQAVGLLRMDPFGLSDWMRRHGGAGIAIPKGSGPMGSAELSPITAIEVRAKKPLRTFDECQQFLTQIRNVIARTSGQPAKACGPQTVDPFGWTTIYLTGRPAFVAETASQMKRDMFMMVGIATALISLAFWLCYRSLLPLVWILFLQILSFLCALIAARVVFGELNIIGMGFSTILLGVSMDYCILVYHHFATSERDPQAWHLLKRGIWLSAITTAGAFGILFFSRFPGFKQLSILIGVGLLTTAWFATALLPRILHRFKPSAPPWINQVSDVFAGFLGRHRFWIRTGIVMLVLGTVAAFPFLRHYPFYNSDLHNLRPSRSEAYRGMDLLGRIGGQERNFPVILQGGSLDDLHAQAEKLGKALSMNFSSSLAILPATQGMESNRSSWRIGKSAEMDRIIAASDFEMSWGNSTRALLKTLDDWREGRQNFTEVRSLISKTLAWSDRHPMLLLRLPFPAPAKPDESARLWERVRASGVECLPADWTLLGKELNRTAHEDFRRLTGWILLIVLALCWVAHRAMRLVMLNATALLLSLLLLFVLLVATGTSMTIMSLLALPLLIGLVIDYSLHLILALEESRGNLKATFRHLAMPVFLTGVCSVIGFGSPLASQQPALQNFGLVMDLGIVSAVLTGLVLLPVLYAHPSLKPHYSRTLYRARWFEAASWLGRWTPRPLWRGFGQACGLAYAWTHSRSVETVRKNLALVRTEPIAPSLARRVYSSFGATLADYFIIGTSSHARVMGMIGSTRGLEHLEKARDEKRGCLIVTAHMSLFELGGYFLKELRCPTTVLTLPEPSTALTKWRADYRARWGAETLEVGKENFALIEIIKCLQAGRFVAALVDRPYEGHFTPVDFPNGKAPFSSGIVMIAMLAQCPVIPVTLYRGDDSLYHLEAHPPIYLEKLGTREETVEHAVRQIAEALKPVLCQHPEQWYQFVPLS